MTEPKTHRRLDGNRKKGSVPLAILRTSEAVKTVVDHPRRLEELVRMLEDKDRGVRGRAAATLARLSESHPSRLIRILARLREALTDDSAYVRWHLVHTFGKLGSRFPAQLQGLLGDLVARLDDKDRVVRMLACRTLGHLAERKPSIVEEFFRNLKKEIPPSVARMLRNSKAKSRSAARR
jgi:HEAT repeat protein